MPEIGWFSSTWHPTEDMERFQDSRHKTFTCGFSFPTPVLLSRVQPRAHSFDENHLISGRTPHFRPQGIASAQDRQHSEQGAIGGCDIGEAAFQGRVEKRARIGLRRDLRRGSWHRFETRFAVRRTTAADAPSKGDERNRRSASKRRSCSVQRWNTPEHLAAVQPTPSRNERRPPLGGLPNT